MVVFMSMIGWRGHPADPDAGYDGLLVGLNPD